MNRLESAFQEGDNNDRKGVFRTWRELTEEQREALRSITSHSAADPWLTKQLGDNALGFLAELAVVGIETCERRRKRRKRSLARGLDHAADMDMVRECEASNIDRLKEFLTNLSAGQLEHLREKVTGYGWRLVEGTPVEEPIGTDRSILAGLGALAFRLMEKLEGAAKPNAN